MKCEMTLKTVIILFPIYIRYESAGNIAQLSVFGLPVYQRVGDMRKFLFKVWRVKGDE